MSNPQVKLKYIAQLISGGTPEVSDKTNWAQGEEGVSWVSIGDMSNRSKVSETSRRVSSKGIFSARLAVAPPGTLLMSMYASLGHTAFTTKPSAWNQAILAIVPQGEFDVKFVNYSLMAQKVNLEALARSSTQSNLNAEQVGNLRISNLLIEEQRRISDFLDSEIGRIEGVLERRIRTSELARQRHQALVDLEMDRILREYGSRPFRRFIFQVEQGSSPLCDNNPAPEDDWGVLKVSAVKLGTFNAEENKHYTEDPGGMARYEVHEGDLLITRANTPSLVGSAALVPQVRKKLIISDKIFRVSLSGDLDPRFLVFAAGGSRVRGICSAVAHGTSQSMVNLKSGDVKAWPIPAAPLEKQVKISEKLEESRFFTERMQEFSERQIDLLEERKRALITAAVTGQIDVTTARGADLS